MDIQGSILIVVSISLFGPLLLSKARFFIHHLITRLADAICVKHGNMRDAAMLFPSRKSAEMCIDFLRAEESSASSDDFRIVELVHSDLSQQTKLNLYSWLALYAVIFPAAKFKIAKAFWQHTGLGISSRRAEFHQRFFDNGTLVESKREKMQTVRENMRREVNGHAHLATTQMIAEEQFRKDLILDQSANAKLAIRERIAQSISSGREPHNDVDVSDVFLYATGMSAIFNVHRMLLAVRGQLKSICYGYDPGLLYMSSCHKSVAAIF